MKRMLTLVVLTMCSVVAIATLGTNSGNQGCGLLRQCWVSPHLLADGGAPAPPWPSGGILVADGGEPAPPWPTPGG